MTSHKLEMVLRTTLHYFRAWRRDITQNLKQPAVESQPHINTTADNFDTVKVPNLDDQMRSNWEENGFLVLPGFFSSNEVDGLDKLVDDLWIDSRNHPSPYTVDVFLGENERRLKLHDAPLEAKNRPYKLNDLYLESPLVRNLILNERLSGILYNLIGGNPLTCNTLNFEFGSEQPFHTDSLYMTPPKDLNLVATWIALEDCLPEAGPLQYYPGSHKIPPFQFSHGLMTTVPEEMQNYYEYMSSEIEKRGLRPEIFCAKRGDVFIWHSQLYHGGSRIANRAKTRRSLVTHYFKLGDLECDSRQHNSLGYYLVRPHQAVAT